MSKNFKVIILLMVMLIGVVGLISGCSNTAEVSEVAEEKYIPVEVQKATTDTIENKISINGKVVANEEITVMPKTVGIVTSVNVKLGDTVNEGDILFTIEKDDVVKNVEQAAKAVELAQNGLNTANINYELNKEKIENAKINLERTKKLYEEGAVSKNQLEQAELAASERNLEAVETQINQALNQVRQSEISYEQAVSGLDNTVVKAPISGVISELNVKEGQIATNSQVAATIVEMNQVYLQLNVVENIVNRLEVGGEVEVNIPSAFDEYITSTISYISSSADPRNQLYPVKVYVDNVDKKIRPGMNGQIKVGLDTVESAIVIKGNAVLDKDGQKVVYVVEDNIAVEKIVTTGVDTGDYVEIKEGINEGDSVIIEGQHYLEDGKTVKVVRGE